MEPDPAALRTEVDEGGRKIRLLVVLAWLTQCFSWLGRVQ